MSDTHEPQAILGESHAEETGPLTAFQLWIVSILFSAVFTIVIWIVGPYLDRFVLGPDTGPEWYYWQLPDPNFTAQVIVWGMYLAHQISVWATIYWAQKNLVELKTRPTKGITKYNWGILVINIFFIFLHLIQTHIWFDGLAQDVPIWTSQGSVIVMLVLILIIENPRRGLFLGKRAGKPMTARVSGLVRRLHMYPIAWAMVYTFWFHPMFYDPQLITGFFYMFVLFTQMAVAYTYIHVDRRWVVFVEGFVGIHAFFVALYNTVLGDSADMWPMFLSGFVFLWVFTYMYAFDMKKVYRWIVTIAYFAFLVWIYLPAPFGYGRDLSRIMMLEFLWIPITLYGLAIVFSAIAYLYLRQRKEQRLDGVR